MKKTIMPVLVAAALAFGLKAMAGEGYVLNLYHFNLQYVAGSDAAMRANVEKSFEPLLDFYLAHPGWKADFELQAQYLEYLADKYPAVLEKLRTLAQSGQAEMISFHYSDQIVLAFPALDEERSLKLTQEVFQKYDVPRSGIMFLQEAWFGEGICAMGKKWGYTAAVLVKNQYDAFQDDPGLPYFTLRGLEVIKDDDYEDAKTGLKVKWYFLGDGELVATGGISPYMLALFKPSQARLKKMERNFSDLEQSGYQIATIGEYQAALHRLSLRPRPLKPILDSPWNPSTDQGVFQWMGKQLRPLEQDYEIRTENWRARSWLLAAEQKGIGWEELRPAWKHQLNSEVSDSTGWTPQTVEVEYSWAESKAAREVVAQACPGCQPEELKRELEKIDAEAFPVKVKVAGAAKAELNYGSVKGRPGLYAVELNVTAGGNLTIAFPFTGKDIAYSPALLETEVVRIPLDKIKHRLHYVGLPNGLIGLDQNLWLIRDNKAGTLGCGINPDKKEIHFRIKGGEGRTYSFRYFVFQGAEKDALDFANSLNQTGQ